MNLSRREQFAIQALQLMDAAVVFVSFWIGVLLRNGLYGLIPEDSWLGRFLDLPKAPLEGVGQVAAVLYLVVPFTPLVLEGFGFYAERYRKSFNRSILEILKALAVITLLVSVVAVIWRFPVSSRPVLFFGVSVSVVLLLVRERVSMAMRRSASDHEQRRLPLILAGTSAATADYWNSVDEETRFRWRVAEEFDLAGGGPDELEKMLEKHAAHRVVFLPEGVPFERLTRAVERCELQGVEAWIAASFIQARIAQPTFDFMGDRAMLVLRSTPGLSWAVQIKDLFDRAAALFLIIVSFPLWLIAMRRDQVVQQGAGVLHPGAGWPLWQALPDVEVPHHVPRRGSEAGRGQGDRRQPDERSGVQARRRPPGVRVRHLAAQDEHRRTAAADQRAVRRHEHGRSAARCRCTRSRRSRSPSTGGG